MRADLVLGADGCGAPAEPAAAKPAADAGPDPRLTEPFMFNEAEPAPDEMTVEALQAGIRGRLTLELFKMSADRDMNVFWRHF